MRILLHEHNNIKKKKSAWISWNTISILMETKFKFLKIVYAKISLYMTNATPPIIFSKFWINKHFEDNKFEQWKTQPATDKNK